MYFVMENKIQYSINSWRGFMLLPRLDMNHFANNHKTYKVRIFILYRVYRGRY